MLSYKTLSSLVDESVTSVTKIAGSRLPDTIISPLSKHLATPNL